MVSRALRVGITGKMGSGKSTLSNLLRARTIPVFESDAVAKEIMRSDSDVRAKIEALLGAGAYPEGELDRAFVAAQIFSDSKKRLAMEAIVHPVVLTRMQEFFDAGRPSTLVAVESALVFQTDLWRQFDYILLVEVPDEVVIERLATSGRFTRADVLRRLKEQSASGHGMKEEADFVLSNIGSMEEFEKSAAKVLVLLEIFSRRELPEKPLHQLELSEDEVE
jgi:dephospho-CoA kinase